MCYNAGGDKCFAEKYRRIEASKQDREVEKVLFSEEVMLE